MHTVILLLVMSGLRISAAPDLTLQDVDLVDGALRSDQRSSVSPGPPVSTGSLDLLRRYDDLRVALAAADPAGAFFVSDRGTADSTSTVKPCSMTSSLKWGCGGPRAAVPGCTTCGRPSLSLVFCSGIVTARTSWAGYRC